MAQNWGVTAWSSEDVRAWRLYRRYVLRPLLLVSWRQGADLQGWSDGWHGREGPPLVLRNGGSGNQGDVCDRQNCRAISTMYPAGSLVAKPVSGQASSFA